MKHPSRLERAEPLEVAAAALAAGQPLRQLALGLGVARSTLRDGRTTVPWSGMPPEVAAALSTPAGARWLPRLVVGAARAALAMCLPAMVASRRRQPPVRLHFLSFIPLFGGRACYQQGELGVWWLWPWP